MLSATTRRRRRTSVAAVALLAILGVSGCTGESSDGSVQSPDAAPTPKSESDDGGTLDVIDTGFTVFDPLELGATYGVVLENSSEADAVLQAQVTVTFLDADGEVVPHAESGETGVIEQQSGGALPGARTAVTGVIYPESEPAEIEVSVESAEWLAEGDHPDIGSITTDNVQLKREEGLAVVTFTAESDFDAAKPGLATVAVFRDSSGDIVAGTQPADSQVADFPPGETAGEFRIQDSALPSDIDEKNIEVYVG